MGAQHNGEAKKGSMYAMFAAAPLIIMKSSFVGLGLADSIFMNKTYMMHISLEIYKHNQEKVKPFQLIRIQKVTLHEINYIATIACN